MEVILLEKIAKLGLLGEPVKVKPGFARNYLIPQGKALPATENNIKKFEVQRAELEKAATQRLAEAEQRAATLQGVKVTLAVQAGEEGRLFGSVTTHDIATALSEAGHKVTKGEIILATGPIRQVGEYEVPVIIHGTEVATNVFVSIVTA